MPDSLLIKVPEAIILKHLYIYNYYRNKDKVIFFKQRKLIKLLRFPISITLLNYKNELMQRISKIIKSYF